jgi:hypothetical protein
MSQFDEVSNMANPTFDAELAISMTVNAKLPKTPQRQSPAAGASDLAVDSLDNKIPIGRARNRTASIYRTLRSNGEQRAKFQGAAVRKATAIDGCGCSKSELQVIHTNPICPGRHLIASAQNSSTHSSVVSIGLGEARRHELDKFRERVAVVESEFRSTLSKEKPFPACLLWRSQMTHWAPAIARVAVRRHDLGLLKRDEGCTLVSL